MLDIIINGAKEVAEKLQQAAEKSAVAMRKGLKRSAIIIEGEAKRIIYAGHPDHLKGDKGRLRGSITHQVDESGLTAKIGSNVIYARIHELGGVIKPKGHPFLAIPMPGVKGSPRDHDDLHLATSLKGQYMLMTNDGEVKYLLRRSVTIPARPYLKPAFEEKGEEASQAFLNVVYEELF